MLVESNDYPVKAIPKTESMEAPVVVSDFWGSEEKNIASATKFNRNEDIIHFLYPEKSLFDEVRKIAPIAVSLLAEARARVHPLGFVEKRTTLWKNKK